VTLFWNFSAPFPLGVNFINIIQAAFARADPKSAKNTNNLIVFFVLLGSVLIKAACGTLMKLRPGRSCAGGGGNDFNLLNFMTMTTLVVQVR